MAGGVLEFGSGEGDTLKSRTVVMDTMEVGDG